MGEISIFIRKNCPKGWKEFFGEVFDHIEVIDERIKDSCYIPRKELIFSAFYLTPYNNIKVVILGQDPYPDPSNACGLSFSCKNGIPSSLSNIFKVLSSTIEDFKFSSISGDISKWAYQGVFLLNSALTTEQYKSGVHGDFWDLFTQHVFNHLNKKKNIVYMFWGRKAQNYSYFIDSNKNLILTASHPSPFSFDKGDEPFSTCNHFNRCNEYLVEHNIEPIDWKLI